MIWATMGGVTVGLYILGRYLVHWWPGTKSLRTNWLKALGTLLPFLSGWAYGALAILSVGGLIGWFFDSLLWLANWLGDVALVLGVGGEMGISSRGTFLPLTTTGSGLMLILTGVVLALMKKGVGGAELRRGVLCGACLGTSAGVAGLAAVPLAQAANWGGAQVYGAFL